MSQLDTLAEKKIELTNQFAIERYKFILDKIKFLDNQYNNYLNLFIKLLTAILGIIISSILISKKGEIDASWVRYIIEASSALIIIISLILIRLTTITIHSWKDYRNDEVLLLSKFEIDIDRKPPSDQKENHWNEAAFITLLWATVVSFILTYLSSDWILTILKLNN
ncbi:hypothetical protein [Photobacterium lipolyticum]|uniref:Uncharacterized protein n=1 Tax=Photobacterium lipolyticum TaxID=266810 RepID=A0A2T3N1H9_9GAMM|nr:hypothetical protein [Photobacterium lipolyticum]PSW06169.1 hypothetical protein C9I89_06575 [Photobacterium lipolyticum]